MRCVINKSGDRGTTFSFDFNITIRTYAPTIYEKSFSRCGGENRFFFWLYTLNAAYAKACLRVVAENK
jgi:hypothetical protein